MAPPIAERLTTRTDEELFAIVRAGLPGMPPFRLEDDALFDLVRFLRTLQPGQARAPKRERVETTDGRTLEGVVLNRTALDLQLRADEERIHLLRNILSDAKMVVVEERDAIVGVITKIDLIEYLAERKAR